MFSIRVAVVGAVLAATSMAAAQADTIGEAGSRELARIAMLDLRLQEDPREADYRITEIGLALAERLLGVDQEPPIEDIELLRLHLQAAWGAHDAELVDRLTRRVLLLDPKDTVAQLRYISGQIAQEQTAEARLKRYARFIGSNLDASVRSRLALDAALLSREMGDQEEFVRLLTHSTTLDPTNKAAASMALTFYSSRVDDPVGRIELITNLLLADPIDPNVHRWMARDLMRLGLYKLAERFHANTRRITDLAGVTDPELDSERVMMLWRAEGNLKVVEELESTLAEWKHSATIFQEQLIEEGDQPPEDFVPPDQVLLPTGMELVRIYAAMAEQDKEIALRSLIDLRATIIKAMDDMVAMQRDRDDADYQLQVSLSWQAQGLEWMRVLAFYSWRFPDAQAMAQNDSRDMANLLLGGMSEELAADEEISAWEAMCFGDYEGAETLFQATLEIQPENFWATIGVGFARARQDNTEGAIESMRKAATDSPLSIGGAWAAVLTKELGGTLADPAVIAAVKKAVHNVPRFVDQMTMDPSSFVSLQAEVQSGQIAGDSEAIVRVTIRNVSPIPLSLGGDRPINARVMLSPRVAIGLDRPQGNYVAEVFDLTRRLRLMPREALVVNLRPDLGVTGWQVSGQADKIVRMRWRVLQGYELGEMGIFDRGALGLTASTRQVVRLPIPEVALGRVGLPERIASAGPESILRMAALTRVLVGSHTEPDAQPDGDPLDVPLAKAWIARYPTLDARTRAAVLAALPTGSMSSAFEAFDAAVQTETDPLPLGVVLISRVRSAQDPAIDAALRSDDPLLKALGSTLAKRLEERAEEPETQAGYAFADTTLNDLGSIQKLLDAAGIDR